MRATLAKRAPGWVLRALGCEPSGGTSSAAAAASTREHTLHMLAASFDALATDVPLLLILEDVHWSDYATLDLVSAIAQRRDPARLLVLCTLRSADAIVSGHPVAAVKRELVRKGLCHQILLDGLTAADVATPRGASRSARRRRPAGPSPRSHGRQPVLPRDARRPPARARAAGGRRRATRPRRRAAHRDPRGTPRGHRAAPRAARTGRAARVRGGERGRVGAHGTRDRVSPRRRATSPTSRSSSSSATGSSAARRSCGRSARAPGPTARPARATRSATRSTVKSPTGDLTVRAAPPSPVGGRSARGRGRRTDERRLLARACAYLGLVARSKAMVEEARVCADKIGVPYFSAFWATYGASALLHLRDVERTRKVAGEGLRLASESGFSSVQIKASMLLG